LKSRLDKTAHISLPPIPQNPDPFEIAYLRGGANELARAVIFSLNQKNLVKFNNEEKSSRIYPTNLKLDRRNLKPIELTALEWFGTTREARQIFQKNGLAETLKPYYETFQARLEMQHFFPDEEFKSRNSRLTLQAFLVFAGLGAYKLITAFFYNGYTNVFGIVFITFIGLFILGIAAKMPRLTKLGETYLKRLQIAFDRIKPSNHYPVVDEAKAQSNPIAAVDPFLLSVGVFGGAALAGTIYSDYNRAFEKAQNHSSISSGGCGSGCGSGSSCSSGGSCGSGCGGCGGGCGG
jgi:uncharacterized protein (TIGR04222 family)